MKRLLLPLLAALALPTAVNAESYWLILRASAMQAVSLEKIEMESMEQCEEQGKIWEKMGGYSKYLCLIGK